MRTTGRPSVQIPMAPAADARPVSGPAPAGEPSAQPIAVVAPLASGVASEATKLGGGLEPAVLAHHLDAAERVFAKLLDGAAAPHDLSSLVERYSELGHAVTKAEAVLMSALDALDPATGGGRAKPADGFVQIQQQALDALRLAGQLFDRLEPSFSKLVHGSSGWPPQPVEVAPDRGDGRPLHHYRNTYKKGRPLSLDERRQEHDKRVEKFLAAGGRFDALEVADAHDVARMPNAIRHDYVITVEAELRLVPRTDERGQPLMDPGHTLLATGSAAFDDKPVLLAGEMWCLRDSAGDLEAVFVANNSGHFKPRYADLDNAVDVLAALGVPRERVILFGGPNNLPSLFGEIAEKHGMDEVLQKLPPPARSVLKAWGSAEAKSPLSVRF